MSTTATREIVVSDKGLSRTLKWIVFNEASVKRKLEHIMKAIRRNCGTTWARKGKPSEETTYPGRKQIAIRNNAAIELNPITFIMVRVLTSQPNGLTLFSALKRRTDKTSHAGRISDKSAVARERRVCRSMKYKV
jgi:hypothetical protein